MAGSHKTSNLNASHQGCCFIFFASTEKKKEKHNNMQLNLIIKLYFVDPTVQCLVSFLSSTDFTDYRRILSQTYP